MKITFGGKGDFKKTLDYLKKNTHIMRQINLSKYGEMGAKALKDNTPYRTGKTAESWKYKVEQSGSKTVLYWYNTNENEGVNIALILQYGHGTGSGYYVQGEDYINPAMRPVFEEIGESLWKEMTRS